MTGELRGLNETKIAQKNLKAFPIPNQAKLVN